MSPSGSGGRVEPAFVPYVGVAPDLPAVEDKIPAGFYHYPADPKSFIDGEVGAGGKVTALLQGAQIPVPKDRNKWWQQLNRKMNIDLDLTLVPSDNYASKLQVTAAGGQFPDLVQMVKIPHLPGLLDKSFTDLSPYLDGDAIKKYPGLAALPSRVWEAGRVNGRIYGVAQPRDQSGLVTMVNGSILAKKGIDPDSVADGEDYLDLCREVTDVKSNRWAFGASPGFFVIYPILQMMGVPNGWAEVDGKFTADFESPAYPDAILVVKKMWDEGLIHPDSFVSPNNAVWWSGETTVLNVKAFAGFTSAWKTDAKLDPSILILPKWKGGGQSATLLGSGYYGYYVAMKKSSPARTEELLRVLNFLAAPFGTQEYLDLSYGVKDHDYTLSGSDPALTDTGKVEGQLGLAYVGGTGATVLYSSDKHLVDLQYKYLSKLIPGGVTNAAQSLSSPTLDAQGSAGQDKLIKLIGEIIQGRRTIADWTKGVEEWRKNGGDKIRAEYEADFVRQNS